MKVEQAKKYIEIKLDTKDVSIAVVLGSGLSFLEDSLEGLKKISTADIPGYPVSTVIGHKGTMSTGTYLGKRLLIMAGRVHYYEGYSYEEVVFPTYIIHSLGIKKLLLTNAAGGVNRNYTPGSLIILDSYIAPFSKIYKNPVTSPYSDKLNALLEKAAGISNVRVSRGCYAYMTGPSFETKAEIDFLRLSGADAVGMSTVPETVWAKELGIETACVSRISNFAAGITGSSLSHKEVLETSAGSQESFITLLKEFIKLI
jgi:purine-nucleoside phosphorylase